MNRDQRTLYVDRIPLIDINQISFAKVLSGKRIFLKLTYEGENKLFDINQAHVGKQLALVINNEPYAAPHILGTMQLDHIEFTAFNKDEAHYIVEEINGLRQFK